MTVTRQVEKQAQRSHSEVVPSVVITYPQGFLHQKEAIDATMSPGRAADTSNARKLSSDNQHS